MDPIPAAVAVPAPASAHKQTNSRAMFLVGIFEMFKALLFLAAAFGLLRMVHKDTGVELGKLLHAMRINGDLAFVKSLLLKAKFIEDPQKRVFGALAAAYALLHGIEGTGLMLRKKWAEYFTVIASCLAIPYEIYELFHRTAHPAPEGVSLPIPQEQRATFVFDQVFLLKLGVFLANVGIVWFLFWHLRRSHRQKLALEQAEAAAPAVAENVGVVP
ncbi:MAG: DUF2127 domain-containing protein [Gluconacetobacter diazotrophicus]|nr:DUF2127 domain-containing protein [Gluconacetobacter diazotrophicus]